MSEKMKRLDDMTRLELLELGLELQDTLYYHPSFKRDLEGNVGLLCRMNWGIAFGILCNWDDAPETLHLSGDGMVSRSGEESDPENIWEALIKRHQ